MSFQLRGVKEDWLGAGASVSAKFKEALVGILSEHAKIETRGQAWEKMRDFVWRLLLLDGNGLGVILAPQKDRQHAFPCLSFLSVFPGDTDTDPKTWKKR